PRSEFRRAQTSPLPDRHAPVWPSFPKKARNLFESNAFRELDSIPTAVPKPPVRDGGNFPTPGQDRPSRSAASPPSPRAAGRVGLCVGGLVPQGVARHFHNHISQP